MSRAFFVTQAQLVKTGKQWQQRIAEIKRKGGDLEMGPELENSFLRIPTHTRTPTIPCMHVTALKEQGNVTTVDCAAPWITHVFIGFVALSAVPVQLLRGSVYSLRHLTVLTTNLSLCRIIVLTLLHHGWNIWYQKVHLQTLFRPVNLSVRGTSLCLQ